MPLPYRRGAERIIRYLTGRYQLGGVLPTNDGYFTGVPKLIHTDVISIGNMGTGLQPLQSFTLPPGSWKDNDLIEIHYAGQFGANNDSKRIQVEVGGVAIHNTGLFALSNTTWSYILNYIRLSSTDIRVTGNVHWGVITRDTAGAVGGTGLSFAIFATGLVGLADMDVNNTVFRLQGESSTATNSNVLHRKSVIYLTRR